LEKTSFHSFIFSNVFHRYRIAGDATAAAGALANAKSRQERYENLFLSISYENRHDSPWDTTIQDEKVIAFSY
jgi:hypothetical protein